MTTKELLQRKDEIIQDPIDRLNQAAKDVFLRNNFVFDAHTHVFDSKCQDEKYFVFRTMVNFGSKEKTKKFSFLNSLRESRDYDHFEYEIYQKAISLPAIQNARFHEHLFKNNYITNQEYRVLKNYSDDDSQPLKDFIQIAFKMDSMLEVYNLFEQKYAIHHIVNEKLSKKKELLSITLGMDMDYGWAKKAEKSFTEQKTELLELSKKKPILPYIPLDPRNPNINQDFFDAFTKKGSSFFGIKLYPALGYLPSDSRYDAIFTVCAEKNIPILTHCGGETVSTFEKRIEVNNAGKSMVITGKTRQFRAYQLNDPKYWESVLKKNPKLRLNLAHFGGEDAWLNTNNPSDSQGRLETIIQLMNNYPNVYADFSFNQENRKMQSAFLSAISKKTETAKLIRKRALYGTDFWVVLNKRNFNDDQRAFIDAIGDFKDDFLCNNVLKYLGLMYEDSIIA